MPDDIHDAGVLTTLVENAVEAWRRACQRDVPDDDAFRDLCNAAGEIRSAGDRAIALLASAAASGEPSHRTAATDLVGRVAENAPAEVQTACLEILDQVLASADGDARIMEACAHAFGRTSMQHSRRVLLQLQSDPSAGVRQAVAAAIPGAFAYGHDDAAVACLVQLSGDRDGDVRDWACFGLGQLEADGPEVREALAARLDDEHDDARCEALVALAKTGDDRALAALTRRLANETICLLELVAAGELADPNLVGALEELKNAWEDDHERDRMHAELEVALKRCAPGAAAAAALVEDRLLTAIRETPELTAFDAQVAGRYPRSRLVLVDRGSGQTRHDGRLWSTVADPNGLDLKQLCGSLVLTLDIDGNSHGRDE